MTNAGFFECGGGWSRMGSTYVRRLRLRGAAGTVSIGAGFGAATAMVNELSHRSADLESASYTTHGWSVPEVFSLVLDSGWAWAGLSVLAGFLVTRGGEHDGRASTRGALAGVLAPL